MAQRIVLLDDTNQGNQIKAELYVDELYLTAEWASDYGEGQLNLTKQQAMTLLVFLQRHLQDKMDFNKGSLECDVCGKELGMLSVYGNSEVEELCHECYHDIYDTDEEK